MHVAYARIVDITKYHEVAKKPIDLYICISSRLKQTAVFTIGGSVRVIST